MGPATGAAPYGAGSLALGGGGEGGSVPNLRSSWVGGREGGSGRRPCHMLSAMEACDLSHLAFPGLRGAGLVTWERKS